MAQVNFPILTVNPIIFKVCDYSLPSIRVKVYWCDRFHKFVFDKCIWPISKHSGFLGFTCWTCGDHSFCNKKHLQKMERASIELQKEFKTGMMLFYDEEGITTETQIGRFKFKIRKGEENGKQTVEDKQ